jgi:hypothetical protein
MMRRTHERLVALFLLGVLLLLPPLLAIFNHPVRILGVPVLYLYLFIAWATVIGLTAAVMRLVDLAHDNRGEPSDTPSGGSPPVEGRRDA